MSSKYLIPKEKGLGIVNTAVFIVGDVSGTGILSLARAVEDTGWTGLILIVVFAIISAYTGILLGEAWIMASELFEDCKGHIQNPYQLLAQKTYDKVGRYVLSVSLHTTVFGGAVVFLLLAADNMQSLVQTLGYDLSFCFWVLILITLLLPLTWFGTPKHFWLIAYGSTLSTISTTAIILVSVGEEAPTQPKVRHHEINGEGFMLALGTIVFALGGHPNFLTLQVDMNRQKDFRKSIFLTFIIVSCLYLPVASVGYFVYGDSLDANIINNLPPGGPTYVALILITIHLLSAFVIILNPLLQEVDMVLHVPKEFTWKRCVTRSFVLICVLFVAETIPKFEYVLSLIGGSSLTILVFICPILFHMRMCKLKANAGNNVAMVTMDVQAPLDEKFEPIAPWRKVLNYEIICIGVLAGVTATVSAIINIVSPDSFSVPCYINITRAST
ncbi:amino acid transporter AVT1I-like [Pecten maximus]|uniref:amino acid transporter AVT1I-like n=1 Tax=Pecten maximus TaxID=6579 RepID=UPI001458FF4A|nr:amino acid transporter AVT1I-like [Pecten maximus]